MKPTSRLRGSQLGGSKLGGARLGGGTSFDPALHGFPFDNSFSTTVWGPFNVGPLHVDALQVGGLCGGMTFAALDNFFTGHAAAPAISPDTPDGGLPAPGTPLHERIFGRHLASLGLIPSRLGVPVPRSHLRVRPGRPDNLLRYPLLRSAPRAFRERENRAALQGARRWIHEGFPVPLGLVSSDGLTDSHQVLAYGFDEGVHATVLHLYDCRYPGVRGSLTVPDNGSECTLLAPERAPEHWPAFFISRYEAFSRGAGAIAYPPAEQDVS